MFKTRPKPAKSNVDPGIHKIGEYSKNLGEKLSDIVFAVEGDKKKYMSIISDTDDLSSTLVKWCWFKRQENSSNLVLPNRSLWKLYMNTKTIVFSQSSSNHFTYMAIHILLFCYLIGCKCIIEIEAKHRNKKQKLNNSKKDSDFESVGIRVIRISAEDATDPTKVFELLDQIHIGKYWQ